MVSANRTTVAVMLLFALLATVASLAVGRIWLPPATLLQGVADDKPNLAWMILTDLRLPRTLLALMVGATLGLGGGVLQGLMRNPLAEPGLLGVTGGAALGAVLAIYFGLSRQFAVATPLAGMAGSLVAVALTYMFGRSGTLTLILAGAAVSGLAGAGLSLALNFAPNPYAAYEITTWLLGSVADREWSQIALCVPFILVGWICLAATPRGLDALTLGETQAESLGINLRALRALTLVGISLSVGAATSIAGSIGFVGLVAPHIVRPFVGHQPSRILLPAALFGAVLLLSTDIAIRVIPTSNELKLGVLTSLIGTPFFFWLVTRLKRMSP